MDRTPVVTCFLRHDGRILLLCRSDRVGSYPGRWAGVAGHLAPARGAPPDDPETAARREIREETGLTGATLVRRGDPFDVEGGGHAWRVHPLLFDVAETAVDPNRETDEWGWAHATEILRRETVPDLWGSYDRVRPTLETVAGDRDHGSAWLSLRALEVLRDEAGLAATGEAPARELAALARELAGARPSMTAVANRIHRAMAAAVDAATGADPAPGAVEAAAREAIDAAATADRAAAGVAADRVEGARVCTVSRSGTVLAALRAADPEAVLVAESRPGGEGVGVAESLAGAFDVTLTTDAALASRIDEWGADAVLVGADTVLPDGSVLNKVGSRTAALAAAREDIACYAAAATDKVSPSTDVRTEDAPGTPYDGEAPIATDNPLFETVPADLVDGVCTEAGILDADDVERVAADHRRRREWA